MHMLGSMKIDANRLKVLTALRKNRESHAIIVKEAREGYVKKAQRALEEKLKLLASGKLVGLTFQLSPPMDQTKVYDTAIKMLEMHEGDTIVLDSTQVRSLMMDEWDWKSSFLHANAGYSATAAASFDRSDDEE